jgi:hypothetical protein
MVGFLLFLVAWVHEGPRATFSVTGNEISTSGLGNAPNWLHTSSEYENFRLKFDYKLAEWAEAAVIVRAPRYGRPAQAGIAIVLAHDFHKQVSNYVTGAIAGVRPPTNPRPPGFGEWHPVAIELIGDQLRVDIDGVRVQEIDLGADAELRQRLKKGYIGFPDLGHRYSVRNVEIEDLGSSHKYVDLFDGRTLNAWALRGAGSWSVRDGSIYGANGHGILYAEPKFKDFELTLQVMSHQRVNAGVFLRGSADAKVHRGFEVQIYSPVDAVYPTGSIYGKKRSNITADYEERWFLMQIRVQGSRCIVRIDGTTVAEYDALSGPDLQEGGVGLQVHMDNASVEFRDVRVRPL